MHVYNLGCTVLDFVHAQLRGVLEHPEHPPKYAPKFPSQTPSLTPSVSKTSLLSLAFSTTTAHYQLLWIMA